MAGRWQTGAMKQRTLRLHRDDPDFPGLLRRVYARVMVCWDTGLDGWCWTLLNASGEPGVGNAGPFKDADEALDAAQEALGGEWEDEAIRATA